MNVAAPITVSPVRRMYWLVRRELWENSWLYLAPLAVAALIVVASAIGTFYLPGNLRGLPIDLAQQREVVEQPYIFAALLVMFTTLVAAVFYCLDALHGEGRDRSILFWKSLPVSDLETVLSKAIVPVVVLPLLTFVITVVTQAIMLLIATARLLGTGSNAALWSHLPFFKMSGMLLYHLVAAHGLWYAPFYGWLLLVSAWARRAPFLWATLPPLAIALLERIAFNTTHFASMLEFRFLGGPEGGPSTADPMSMAALTVASPSQFLTSASFWAGLVFFAACLAAAVRLRRYQGPI